MIIFLLCSRGPGKVHRRLVNEAGDVPEDMEWDGASTYLLVNTLTPMVLPRSTVSEYTRLQLQLIKLGGL